MSVIALTCKYGKKVFWLQYEILCNQIEDCLTVVIITIDDSCWILILISNIDNVI